MYATKWHHGVFHVRFTMKHSFKTFKIFLMWYRARGTDLLCTTQGGQSLLKQKGLSKECKTQNPKYPVFSKADSEGSNYHISIRPPDIQVEIGDKCSGNLDSIDKIYQLLYMEKQTYSVN